jgi:hypothetical protein
MRQFRDEACVVLHADCRDEAFQPRWITGGRGEHRWLFDNAAHQKPAGWICCMRLRLSSFMRLIP